MPPSGRTLVLALGLVAAATARLLQQEPGAWDVIIVGAGMAGIAAARNLIDAGLRVLILEGRDRPAGRLEAIQVPGGWVDKGAMWTHRAIAGENDLFDLMLKLGLPMGPRQDYSSVTSYWDASGDRVGLPEYLRVYGSYLTQFQPRIRAMCSTPGTPDQPLSDVYSSWLKGNTQFTPSDAGLANIIMHTNYQVLLSGNVTQLSTVRLGDAKSIPAVDVMLRDGFPTVVEALMKQGQPLSIRYNTVVTAIDQSESGVTLSTAAGDIFTAPYAIMTVPLGLLKEQTVAFTPALPEAKLKAIREMGYGVLDKALFVFDRVFWEKSDFVVREMPDWSGRWAVFLNYNKLFKIPVLAAIHVADTARQLETMTDDQIRVEGMAVLRRIYERNGVTVPEPIQFAATRWAADPFALGAYSFFAVGNEKNITATLAEPVGRLLFAGEATSSEPATVTGAYVSGLREAGRVLALHLDGAN